MLTVTPRGSTGGRTSAGTLTFILLEGCHGAAPPWGPGPPASAAPLEEASGVLGPRPLSAQARSLSDPHTHTGYHSSDSVRHTISQPTCPSQPAALSLQPQS